MQENNERMHVNMLWLYHDIMDLYGDKGNVYALKYRMEKQDIDVTLDLKTLGDDVDFTKYDIVIIGGGADKEQNIIAPDLLAKKDNILKAIKGKTFFLLICGSYQLFGKYYEDANKNKIPGLGILDFETESSKESKRCIGNICIKANLDGQDVEIYGFENHGGQTINVKDPFGEVIQGQGNYFGSKYEGYYKDNILGTYIHGPLLPKNSVLTDHIIKKVLRNKYGKDIQLKKLDDTFEQKAVEVLRKRIENDEFNV